MKVALGVLAMLLIAGTSYMQPAHSQVQAQAAPRLFAQMGRGAPPPPETQEDQRRERERFDDHRREDRRREELGARERCNRMPNPMERARCFDRLR